MKEPTLPDSLLRTRVKWAGLAGGPLLALLVFVLLPDSYAGADGAAVPFAREGRAAAAMAVWMGIWWLTEAIDVYATALLPIAVFPLIGVAPVREAAAPYANEMIYLFLGGFILALSMQKWGLHLRIALLTLRLFGTEPRRMVGAFMVVTAVLSMWVSNTATAAMMLPIAVSVTDLVLSRRNGGAAAGESGRNFALCLMLGIAYGASIGGVGTIIGTPPNLLLVSYMRENLGIRIGFAQWLMVGLPLVAVFLPIAWLLLTRVLYPVRLPRLEGGREMLREEYARLGPVKRGEWGTFIVFMSTATAWIFRPLLVGIEIAGVRPLAGLSDPGIALIASLSLFLIPAGTGRGKFVMEWETAKKLPWGILVLFGGGLSLAAALQQHGVGDLLGSAVLGAKGLPTFLVILLVTAGVIFLTEITSNTATAATLIPILAGMAPGLGLPPTLLIVPAALAASWAFMLPVATPPNAIVFGSGRVTLPQMARAGFWLNWIGILIISLLAHTLALPLLG